MPGGPIHIPLPMGHHHSNDLGDSHPMEHIEMIVAHPIMEHQVPHPQQQHPSMREMRMAVLQEEPIPQESMRPHCTYICFN